MGGAPNDLGKALVLITATLAGLLITAGTASADQRTVVKDKRATLEFGQVSCGGFVSAQAHLGPRVDEFRVVDPVLGAEVVDEIGDSAGRIVAIQTIHQDDGQTSVRFTIRGEAVACQQPHGEDTVLSTVRYRIRTRYSLSKGERGYCGKAFMFYTRANVFSNGYVRCGGARSLARSWRRYQERKRFCLEGFCQRTRIRGFRCAMRFPGEGVLAVRCKRGRKFVTWEWGD